MNDNFHPSVTWDVPISERDVMGWIPKATIMLHHFNFCPNRFCEMLRKKRLFLNGKHIGVENINTLNGTYLTPRQRLIWQKSRATRALSRGWRRLTRRRAKLLSYELSGEHHSQNHSQNWVFGLGGGSNYKSTLIQKRHWAKERD